MTLSTSALFHRGNTAALQKPHLGIGPMSKNCVDAVIELANEDHIPFTLIASRRQIEADFLGGGYVNNWDTFAFARYVRTHSRHHNVLLGRDHGGPWQNPKEKELNLDEAMNSAKRSYQMDIEAGFRALHIDPYPILGLYSADEWVDRYVQCTTELYAFCAEHAQACGQEVTFEVGTEMDPIGSLEPDKILDMVHGVVSFCERARLAFPTFVVIPLGTRVMELQNIGSLERGDLADEQFGRLGELFTFCRKHNLLIKAHNADYLSTRSLQTLCDKGIDALNIAPELGVVETRALLGIMEELGLDQQRDAFFEIAYKSRKWDKWMLPNTTATDEDRAIIAGHYVFSTPEFQALRANVESECRQQAVDLDQELKSAVKAGVLRIFDALVSRMPVAVRRAA